MCKKYPESVRLAECVAATTSGLNGGCSTVLLLTATFIDSSALPLVALENEKTMWNR